MAHRDEDNSFWTSPLIKPVLGFIGVIAAFKLLPKTLVYMVRRYILGLITELIVVVIAALLTEKLAKKLTGQDADDHHADFDG